jgi:parallel beta-helix repeat protein
VTTDLRLEDDLNCPAGALTVTGTGVTINLNGHTIAGAGVGNGITVTAADGVAIYGGTISGFFVGTFVNVSTGVVIKEVEYTGNVTAVLLQGSSGNTLKSIIARQNTTRAFMIRPTLTEIPSTDNDVVENQLVDNPTGIFLIRQPGNTIKGNTISGASIAAIDLGFGGASGNIIKGNLLTSSGAGIRFGAGWTDNTILGNNFVANVCAIQGPFGGNILQGNVLSGNTTDFCP